VSDLALKIIVNGFVKYIMFIKKFGAAYSVKYRLIKSEKHSCLFWSARAINYLLM